jgi:hypothetical protein
MHNYDSAPASSSSSVHSVRLSELDATSVVDRSCAKVTSVRAKVTPATGALRGFALAKVTKVTPASDSAWNVQLVHFVRLARQSSRRRAHALRTQLWQLPPARLLRYARTDERAGDLTK